MRPTPIPDAEVWEGAVRRVIAPPDGDLTNPDIRPVEALVDQTVLGQRFSMRCELDDGDLDVLRANGVVWVSMLGDHLHPFAVDVAAGAIPPSAPSLRVEVAVRPGDMPPEFKAWVSGVAAGAEELFIRGCIEALEEMLRRNELG